MSSDDYLFRVDYLNHSDWLLFGFIGCVLLAIAFAVLSQRGKLKLPRYVFIIIIVVGMLQLAALQTVQRYEAKAARHELTLVIPSTVSNVLLQSDGQIWAVVNTNDIGRLFSAIQSVEPMPAHHSHRTKVYEISFLKNKQQYRYSAGQDSAKSHEFWIFQMPDDGTEGREIGRVRSAHLGPMLEGFLARKP